jgi:hypothetical protein
MGEIVLRLGVCVREERADLTVLVARPYGVPGASLVSWRVRDLPG